MEQTSKSMLELVNSVNTELLRLRYSPVTISKCNSVWQKLLSYSQTEGVLSFSELLAKNFLAEYYNYPTEYSSKFPYGTRIAVRAVRMLGDFQLYGVILRKRKNQQPDCPTGFTDAIRRFVLYSYQHRNSVKTVQRKVFIINCFIEYLTLKNVTTCSEISAQHISGYITSLIGLRKITANRYLSTLKCFYGVVKSGLVIKLI